MIDTTRVRLSLGWRQAPGKRREHNVMVRSTTRWIVSLVADSDLQASKFWATWWRLQRRTGIVVRTRLADDGLSWSVCCCLRKRFFFTSIWFQSDGNCFFLKKDSAHSLVKDRSTETETETETETQTETETETQTEIDTCRARRPWPSVIGHSASSVQLFLSVSDLTERKKLKERWIQR